MEQPANEQRAARARRPPRAHVPGHQWLQRAERAQAPLSILQHVCKLLAHLGMLCLLLGLHGSERGGGDWMTQTRGHSGCAGLSAA